MEPCTHVKSLERGSNMIRLFVSLVLFSIRLYGLIAPPMAENFLESQSDFA